MDTLPIRVLLVDENADAWHTLFSEITNPRFQFQSAASLTHATEMLVSFQFDAAICSQSHSEQWSSLWRESGRAFPWILLVEEAVEAPVVARLGASDFLSRNQLSAPMVECCVRFAIERQKCENARVREQQFAQATYDALLYPFAVLSGSGEVVALNAAWRKAMRNDATSNFLGAVSGLGANYLHECDRSEHPEAANVAIRLRALLVGDADFQLEYQNGQPGEECWFEMRATRFAGTDASGAQVPHVRISHEDISTRKRAEAQLRQSEERYRSFITATTEAIWRFELDEPIAVSLPADEQIERFYQFAYLAECNDAMAQMYGCTSPQELIGMRLGEFLVRSDPANLDYLRLLIRSNYRVHDVESHELDRDGNPKFFLNTLTGIVEDGFLLRGWGTQRDVTEKKKTEDRLRQSSELLRAVTEGTTDAVFAKDLEGRYLMINTAGARYFGRDAPEIVGKTDADFVPPETAQSFVESDRRIVESGEVQTHEETELLAGATRTYLATKGPLRAANGEILGVVGISRDITQRKQFEQTLHDTTREIVTIWESMTDAFYSLDRQWRFTHVNSEAARLLGRGAAELLGKNVWDEFPATVELRLYSEYHRAVDQNLAVSFEEFYAPQNRWYEIHAYPSALGLSVYFRDISERKRAEEQLHFQKSLLETPTESFLDGILVVSSDGRILSCNQRFMQMWEIPAHLVDEGDDKPLLQAVTERVANPDAFLERVRALYENREERSHEELLLCDGRIFDRYSAPLTTTDGSYEGRVWYFRDITTQRHAEKALRESEERSRAVIHGALDCIITVDQHDRIVEFNPAAETTFGWTSTEALGQVLSQLILPPESQGAHGQGIANYLATGAGPILDRRIEVPALRKDRTPIIAELSVTMITHASLPLFTAHLRDITESKKAQDALRASEERFQSIVANVPGMVYQFALHPDGSIQWPFVGEGSREVYELEPETIQSHPTRPVEMIHPDDIAGFQSSVMSSAQTLLPWQWEGRIRTDSGKTRWIQGASRPQRLSSGVVVWDGLLMDITARRDAESERDRFFTMSLEMLGIAGFDGYFKRVNPAFSHTMGYSEAEFLAKPFVYFVHPDDRTSTQEAALKLSQGDHLVGFENRYLTKSGTWRWLEWKAVGVIEEGVIYAAARDVTAQKEAKIALEQSEMRLRALVESIDEIVFESDGEGHLVNVWTSDETLLTVPKHELLGRHITEVWAKTWPALSSTLSGV
jgi:PAS domain S-box-containing protein